MRVLTPSQVKRRATTPKEAIKVTVERYEQLYTLTKKETLTKEKRGCLTGTLHCGLCILYLGCLYCPLYKIGERCGRNNSMYSKLRCAQRSLVNSGITFTEYKRELMKMITLLKSLKE